MRADGLCQDCRPEFLRFLGTFKTRDRTLTAGSDLFASGEPSDAIYYLLDGWVCLYKLLQDGRRQILHFALPGAVLGFPPSQGGMSYSAQALTDATVSVIPRNNLSAMFGEYPEVAMRIAWLVSRDRSLAYEHLLSVGRRSGRQRVAHLILELFVRSRMQWPGHDTEEMHLPLTQEHIGDTTGLTGVHVNRVLRDLRREQILEFHYQRLRVLNPDKLLDVAGVDPQLMFSWIPRVISD
jgi:CRP-like cAMP-binding protein